MNILANILPFFLKEIDNFSRREIISFAYLSIEKILGIVTDAVSEGLSTRQSEKEAANKGKEEATTEAAAPEAPAVETAPEAPAAESTDTPAEA